MSTAMATSRANPSSGEFTTPEEATETDEDVEFVIGGQDVIDVDCHLKRSPQTGDNDRYSQRHD